jgi:type II secretory pathway component PulJ
MGATRIGAALLEVLISVSILSFGLGMTMEGMGTYVRTQSRLEESGTARRLAESQLVTFIISSRILPAGELNGQFEEPFSMFTWSAVVSDPTGDSPYRLIEVDVWKNEEPDDRRVASIRGLGI